MGKPVMIFIPKDCNMIIAFETEEELLKKTDNRRMLPLYGYAEQHKKEFPNLYLAYFKGARANKTPAEMDRMDKALKKVVKIAEYMICLTAQSTSCTRCPAWEKPAIMYPATMGHRTPRYSSSGAGTKKGNGYAAGSITTAAGMEGGRKRMPSMQTT